MLNRLMPGTVPPSRTNADLEPMLICGIREGLTKGAILPKSIWLDVPQKTIGLVKDGFGFTPEAISFCELYSRIRQGVLDSTGSGDGE